MAEDGVSTEAPKNAEPKAARPTKSGLDSLLDRFQAPTEDQRKLLQEFKDGKVSRSAEVDKAIEAERDERIKENLPSVAKFYKEKFQEDLRKAREDAGFPLYSGFGEHLIQHRIKILKDLSKLLDFKPLREGMTDTQAQDIALEGLFRIMLDSYSYGLEGQINIYFAGEKNRLKKSGDPESPEIKRQLADLYELSGRHSTLTSDLWDKFNWHPWFNEQYSSIINIRQGESDLRVPEIQSFNVDPDYYNAYYTKYATYNQWSSEVHKDRVFETGVIPKSVEQRIVSKWEQLPVNPSAAKAVA